jgi:CRP-like cAMP-binding protein
MQATMALIDHSYRSATVTAETPLRCLQFVAWVFRPFAVEHPETAWALPDAMVQRVRDARPAKNGPRPLRAVRGM